MPPSALLRRTRRRGSAASERPWTVLPHGPIEKLEPNLWAVEGALPRGHVTRRMCIARTADGRLLFLNGIPLREEAMRKIEEFGIPSFLLVPNWFHRLDIAAFARRYQGLRVLTGARSRPKVEEVVRVDGAWDDAPRDPGLSLVPIAGTRFSEPVLMARNNGRASLCFFGDALMNLPHLRGLEGLLLRVIGSTGGPRVTPLARLIAVRDRRALRDHFLQLAETPGLVRVIPCHGGIISRDPSGVLRRVANRL